MADNFPLTPGSGRNAATDEVSYSGDTADVQLVKVVQTTGSEGAKTVVDPAHDDADAGNPLKIGGKAISGAPTPVAANDRVNAWHDLYGRQVVALADPDLANTANLTSLRDLQMAQRYTMWFDSLADGVSAAWTQTTANGGTVTNTGGEGLLKTSTATNGSSQIVGPTIPYFAGRQEWFNSSIRTGDTGVAGNIRRWGKYTVSGTTPQDGFYYELSGTTLNAVTVKGGSATAVAVGSWTLVGTNPFTLDANFHQWEIRYTANTVWFLIDGILRHVAGGSTAAPLTNTLSLPISATNVKTSGATDITLAIRNIGTGGFGEIAGAYIETGTNGLSAQAVGGGTPHDSVDSGNPVKIGFKASSALPTAVANSDRANAISDLFGRQLVAHVDPTMFVSKSFNTTSTATGSDVWSPTSGKKIAITSVVIGTYGTTAGRIILWFGDNADTTYSAGTDQLLLAFSAAPSSTSKPGLVFTPATPVFCTTADRELHITTDANISIDVAVHGYEW